jgi:hypothetical protein
MENGMSSGAGCVWGMVISVVIWTFILAILEIVLR